VTDIVNSLCRLHCPELIDRLVQRSLFEYLSFDHSVRRKKETSTMSYRELIRLSDRTTIFTVIMLIRFEVKGVQ